MLIEKPKKLSPSVKIDCYCCDKMKAEYLCRFRTGELLVQVCLCPTCMKHDMTYLLKNTIGLPYPEAAAALG